MIRHYCDVCGKEVNGFEVNNMLLAMKEPIYMHGLMVAEKEMNYELCENCAKKIAIYTITKCKEDN